SQSKRASVAHSQQTPTPPGFASAEQYQWLSDQPFIPGNFDSAVVQGEDIDAEAGKTVRDFTVYGFGTGWWGRVVYEGVSDARRGVPPSPTSLAVSNARAQPPTHTGTLIDTRRSTALSDYGAGDDEERKRERRHSWLAEVRGGEELVLGGLAEEGQDLSSSSAARAMAGMGELKSPGLYSVWTSIMAAETSLSGSTRKSTIDEKRAGGEVFRKVPSLRSRSRPRELGFASARYAMRMGSRGRTLSSPSQVGPEIFEREARVRDSIDSIDSVDSTASSNGGAMDLEELSIMTADVFS
ncbi:hypothetical protein FRC01_002275, partial [Tulasnella sp. 417]